MTTIIGDVSISLNSHVAVVEMQRPPHNFFDVALIKNLVEAFQSLDDNPECRAIVLAAAGKSFCAGADFSSKPSEQDVGDPDAPSPLYVEAARLFDCKTPVVGAIHGAAIGGGLGLALVPDFRVSCAQASFSANFVKLGFHPGFALTVTLPELIGQQKAKQMFYTGCRIKGEQAFQSGLVDDLVPQEQVREKAIAFAEEIAVNAPLAVVSVRATMRQGLVEKIIQRTDHENREQQWQRNTEDFKEGIKAVAERRPGNFVGR